MGLREAEASCRRIEEVAKAHAPLVFLIMRYLNEKRAAAQGALALRLTGGHSSLLLDLGLIMRYLDGRRFRAPLPFG
jgi:hypothetical protein